MKKMKWMTGALVVSMVGCNTAQKQDLAIKDPEDRAYQEEVIESFSDRGNISTLMAFYEDDIRSGKLNLGEMRRANRGPASVVPVLGNLLRSAIKAFEKDASKLDQFVDNFARELNIQASKLGLKGVEFKPGMTAAQKVEALEKHLKDLDNKGVETQAKLANNLFGPKGAFAAAKSNNDALIKTYKEVNEYIAKDRAITEKTKAALAGTGKSSEELEAFLASKFKKEAQTVRSNDGTVEYRHAASEAKMKKRIEELKASVKKGGHSPDQEAAMLSKIDQIYKHTEELFRKTGEWPMSPRFCDVLVGPAEVDAYLELAESRVKHFEEYRSKMAGMPYCDEAKIVPDAEFQAKRGRDLAAVEQMGACHLTNTKNGNVAARLSKAGRKTLKHLPNCGVRKK